MVSLYYLQKEQKNTSEKEIYMKEWVYKMLQYQGKEVYHYWRPESWQEWHGIQNLGFDVREK